MRTGAGRLLVCALLALAASCDRSPEPGTSARSLQFEAVPAGAAPAARGERLANVLGCRGCHGRDHTGHVWMEDPKQAVLFTSNLTRALPAYSDEQLARSIRLGVRPDGSLLWEMPSQIFTHLSAPDMAALIAWLRTVPPGGEMHPRIAIGPEGRQMIARGDIRPASEVARANRDIGPLRLDGGHDWARYMIRATCSECHGLELTGSAEPGDESPPPDLVVVGAYTRAQFHQLLRTGRPLDGRRLGLMADVARGRFVHFTDREVDAIYDYLIARANRPQ